MKYTNLMALYRLDKKLCGMIIDIEKLNKDMSEEWEFLGTLERYLKDIDEVREASQSKAEFESVMESAITMAMIAFKIEIDKYTTNRTQNSKITEWFGKSDKVIDTDLKEQRNQRSLEVENANL